MRPSGSADAGRTRPYGVCTRRTDRGSIFADPRRMSAALSLLFGTAALSCVSTFGATFAVMRRRGAGLRAALAASQWALSNAQAAQSERLELGWAVADLVADVVLSFDRDDRLSYVSASSAIVLGYDPVELIAAATMHEDSEECGPLAVVRAARRVSSAHDGTVRLRHRDGSVVWAETRCHHVLAIATAGSDDAAWETMPQDVRPDSEAGHLPVGRGPRVVVFRDVTRRVLAEQRLTEATDHLARLTMLDPLTGLPNRTSFLETVANLLATDAWVAVLLIDLDRFKPFNDLYGWAIGDAIVRAIGKRLAHELEREPMVARLGADEFAALLRPCEDDSTLAARARDILRVIAEPIRIGDMSLDVSATIGIAVSPRDGDDAASLLRRADIAMAHGKQAGSNCYRFFEQRMSDELTETSELKADLRSAIAAGELVPYFQPLVRLSDSRVVGFEVLARWEHPEKGVLSPLRFLPLVEEIGLSAQMFAAILSAACEAARHWPSDIRLSVNISPRELQDESLPEDVRGILERWTLDGSRLEVEITEDALINDSRVARGVLDGLRALGVTVALDDFGTGYSSIYHLRELPFDKVKIDKSFMQSLTTNAKSARYVAAMIGFGTALGLELTAEGIEDVASMRRVRDLGCTYGQGYLFGRPMPATEAGLLVATGFAPMMAAE